jgi:peptidoglycan/LPS O-acetylase OafA/YrhL
VGRFLATRWLRLAPLYVLLCGVFLVMLALRNGQWADQIAQRLAWNASFAFGFADPAVSALLIGGWSLGLEFMYYLAFPLAARVLPRPWMSAAVFALLAALQFAWIDRTVGTLGWADAVVAYHQFPAFAAYFFGGCVLGHWQRQRAPDRSLAWAVAACAAMTALLLALMPARGGDELLGLRGAVLFAACFVVAHLTGRAKLQGPMARAAAWLGEATYGLYLLHPMLFFALVWFAAGDPQGWPVAARWAVVPIVIATAALLALLSERRFEQPIRRWGARHLRPRADARGKTQSDAASISS